MPIKLYKTATVTTAFHNVTTPDSFIFPVAPMGSVWTGSIQILNAPVGVFNVVSIGGIVWAVWNGYQPSPVIQAIGGDQIQVDTYRLSYFAGTGKTYEAVLVGKSDSDVSYVPVIPQAAVFPVFPADNSFGATLAPATPNNVVIAGVANANILLHTCSISLLSAGTVAQEVGLKQTTTNQYFAHAVLPAAGGTVVFEWPLYYRLFPGNSLIVDTNIAATKNVVIAGTHSINPVTF